MAHLWDAETGRELYAVAGSSADGTALEILSAEFTRDGEWIVAVVNDNSVRIWNAADGTPLRTFARNRLSTSALAISSDKSRLAVASSDKIVRIWDPRTGEQRSMITAGATYLKSLHFVPDERLLGIFDDGSAQTWPLEPLAAARRAAPRRLSDAERREYLPEELP
jgi:WD40 repeat protein